MSWFLITGANRGIGLELTRQALDQDHQVFATARNPAKASELNTLKESSGGRLHILELDVNDSQQVAKVVSEVERVAGKLDVLVNNAGINSREPAAAKLGTLEGDAILRIIETNCLSPLLLTQAFLPLLKKGERSRVVAISSQLGSIENKRDGDGYAYSISKAAMNMAFRTAAADLKPHSIAVVMVHPGWVRTDMGGQNATTSPHDSARGIMQIINGLEVGNTGRFIDFAENVHPW